MIRIKAQWKKHIKASESRVLTVASQGAGGPAKEIPCEKGKPGASQGRKVPGLFICDIGERLREQMAELP